MAAPAQFGNPFTLENSVNKLKDIQRGQETDDANSDVLGISFSASFDPGGLKENANGFRGLANAGRTACSHVRFRSGPDSNGHGVCWGVPASVAVNAATNQIYVANYGNNTVSVISTPANEVIATVQVGSRPVSVAVNPTTGFVYAANNGGNSVSVIDPSTNTVTATLAVGTAPYSVAFSPVTGDIYVANSGSNTVSVLDGSSYGLIATVNVGSEPYSVAVNTTTGVVYVANSGSNTVSVLSPANAVIATVGVGSECGVWQQLHGGGFGFGDGRDHLYQ